MVASALAAVTPIKEREFRLFQQLIVAEAGIFLSSVKKPLLVGRLSRRLRELGLRSFGDYYEAVRPPGCDERERMIEAVCTHETHFFREPQQFRFLGERVLPALDEAARAGARPRRIRVWSAACSSGEEPYSLAMLLLDRCPGWGIEIVATDISRRILRKAEAGVWPIARAGEIPSDYLKRFMLRGVGSREGTMAATSELRSVIRFDQVNLKDAWPLRGAFDLVFCRNVLIYFAPETRQEVVRRIADRCLAAGGHLFLGHAETLSAAHPSLRCVGPTVYAKTAPPGEACP
ncbi:MAG TPA: protein-glutamate O-methyltransferase CheR [Vicinamibacteria bacterium]|nr:protein-glutamate O-methyltransferase CheR [Vicinamibacteria bacterium]